MIHNRKNPDGKNPENLTRYQSTLLRQLPLSLDELKKKKQTTVRWCYKRNLLEIHKGIAQLTAFGDLCLQAVQSADVNRKESAHYGDFTKAIQDLVDVARYERLKARQERSRLKIIHRSAAA